MDDKRLIRMFLPLRPLSVFLPEDVVGNVSLWMYTVI